MEYEVCLTLLHMASTENRTPNLLILSPTPYLLGHMLLCCVVDASQNLLLPVHQRKKENRYNSIRPGFLAGNSVFWREIPSVNIVSIASYKMNHNAAIRKQMWFIFLIAGDYTYTNPMIHFSLK